MSKAGIKVRITTHVGYVGNVGAAMKAAANK
jgi:hypothetical protein